MPQFPGLGERHYWPVDDPVVVEGSEDEKLEAFRRARDEIEQHSLTGWGIAATRSEDMTRKKVLFLCTGNSCRSQMAEGLVNHFLGEGWEASSAGTKPSGHVHSLAIKAMAELDIDISDQRSKSVEGYRDAEFDVVITVCDDAAENCPLWLGSGNVHHIGFPDPAEATGSEEERMEVFREVRDGLRREVLGTLRGEGDEGKKGEAHETA